MQYNKLELGMIVEVDGDYGIITGLSESDNSHTCAYVEWFDKCSNNCNAWWGLKELNILEDPAAPYRENEHPEETCHNRILYIDFPDGSTKEIINDEHDLTKIIEYWCNKNGYKLLDNNYPNNYDTIYPYGSIGIIVHREGSQYDEMIDVEAS